MTVFILALCAIDRADVAIWQTERSQLLTGVTKIDYMVFAGVTTAQPNGYNGSGGLTDFVFT